MTDFNKDALLKSSNIRERYQISKATLHRWINAGKLPKPQYLNRQMVWRKSVIEEAEAQLLTDKNPSKSFNG